jgi:alanine racemase
MARRPKAPQRDPDQISLAGPPQVETGARLDIDLNAVHANYLALSRHATPAECAAVVKADGYGLGIGPVTRTLVQAGCKTFFVADLQEARSVRADAPEAVIYVLNGVAPGSGPTFAELYAQPIISSLVELAEWDHFVASANWHGGAALQVDTGINRLGLSMEEAAALAPRIASETHGLTLLMSHFACADTPTHPLNDKQIRDFREIRVLFRGVPSSLANSSGIFLGDSALCDLVRPGSALFGVNPTPQRANPMQPVVRLSAPILQVRHVPKGGTVGYGAAWTAKRASRVAIVGLGYADGYHRVAGAPDTKGAGVMIGGKLCPFAGRVSMDLMAVDVTDVSEGTARRGETVTLIGDDLTVDTVGAAWRTIGYEVLTSLGKRYHRVYQGG